MPTPLTRPQPITGAVMFTLRNVLLTAHISLAILIIGWLVI